MAGYDKSITDKKYRNMSGDSFIGHLGGGLRKIRVREENRSLNREAIELAKKKLKNSGYMVMEEGSYRRVVSGGRNEVLPRDNINNNFRVEDKRRNRISYSFSRPRSAGPTDGLEIRFTDIYKKKGVDDYGDPEYYDVPTALGLVLKYNRGSGTPDYIVYMKSTE